MSEDQHPGPDEPTGERTGNPAVDAVIESVEDLRERPLEEHAAVFEAAHDRLRRALDPTGPDAP